VKYHQFMKQLFSGLNSTSPLHKSDLLQSALTNSDYHFIFKHFM